jgi:phosphate ABC transporter phosphate-binding protein
MQFRRYPALLTAWVACELVAGCKPADDRVTLQGAGATFPAPLYKRWFLEYYKLHPEIRVNYQPVGSGAGIRQFTEGVTTFGASDAYMSQAEIDRVREKARDVVLLPMTAGSIVLCYNLPGGIGGLKLARKAYVDIFLGNITSWADPRIQKDNPDAYLPDVPITVVRRSDGSGTTYAFTNHLNAISDDWKKDKGGPGKGKSVSWPVGIGGKGNSGVAALIEQTPGAIGYLEYGYAELLQDQVRQDTGKPVHVAVLEKQERRVRQGEPGKQPGRSGRAKPRQDPGQLAHRATRPRVPGSAPDRHVHLADLLQAL